MIKIAVCDDNELQIDLLKDVLEEYIDMRHMDAKIYAFGDGDSLIEHVRKNGFFDAYILDLILPGMNGMEVASTLRLMKDSGKIIFLTSTVAYAVSSYDVDAFYYLLKPLDVQKLFKILDNAFSRISSDNRDVVIKSSSGTVKFSIDSIMYIDIDNRCPNYHLSDGRCIKGLSLRGTFKEAVKPFLEYNVFAFCGVSLLINTRYVNSVDSDTVLLSDGTLLYPSKSGISELKRIL